MRSKLKNNVCHFAVNRPRYYGGLDSFHFSMNFAKEKNILQFCIFYVVNSNLEPLHKSNSENSIKAAKKIKVASFEAAWFPSDLDHLSHININR